MQNVTGTAGTPVSFFLAQVKFWAEHMIFLSQIEICRNYTLLGVKLMGVKQRNWCKAEYFGPCDSALLPLTVLD